MQALQRAAAVPSTSSATRAVSQPRHASLMRPMPLHGCTRPTPFSCVQPARQQQFRAPSRSVACQGLFGLGLPEIAVIAGIAALVFGPSKLPELGKGLGKTIKSFQTAAKEFETELKQATSDDAPTATGTGTPASPAAPADAKKEVKKE